MGWLTLVPRKVRFVALGAILAAGAGFWLYRRGVAAGELRERLKADREAVAVAQAARTERAKAVDSATKAAKPVILRAAALHDSVRVIDTTMVTITLPALGTSMNSLKSRVELPAIVVRRIVADSLLLFAKDVLILAQAEQISADSTLIIRQADEIRTLERMKAPTCGAKCKVAAVVTGAAVAGEVIVRIARALKGR